MSVADLMRNSSQKAGCMRRSPASHCCHVRTVVCTSAPAAVCDRLAASRAERISAGSGLAEGPFGPRFGWFAISGTVICTCCNEIGSELRPTGYAACRIVGAKTVADMWQTQAVECIGVPHNSRVGILPDHPLRGLVVDADLAVGLDLKGAHFSLRFRYA